MNRKIIPIIIGILVLVTSATATVAQYNQSNGAKTVLIFNGTGTVNWTAPTDVTAVEYLIVGGGGGGGFQYGGGGGGGGFCTTASYAVTAGNNYTIVVGAGGAGATVNDAPKGLNSSFDTIVSYGGGGGWTAGANGAAPPLTANGSSGGGGGVPPTVYTVTGGYGTTGQGFNGGTGNRLAAGGGGGAGQIGENSQTDGGNYGGDGGNGLTSNITGSVTTYAGGGGGCGWSGIGSGGTGGGGDGNLIGSGTPTSGTNGYGGGGGGATGYAAKPGGNGGSGVVILSYTIPGSPQVSFTSNVVSGFSPLAVQFNDTSVTTPTAWNWSFKHITPGNNTDIWWSTSQNATNTFAAGSYNIHLNVSNASGFTTTTADYIITSYDVVSNTTSTDGEYTIIKWNISGNSYWTAPTGVTSVEYLIVGGGGAGGIQYGGGGGGGGVKNGTMAVTPGTTYQLKIGNGGQANYTVLVGGNGGTSNFSTIGVTGGGGGGGSTDGIPVIGGSGGGGGVPASGTIAGAAGISGEGQSGGSGYRFAGGGGGGNQTAGQNGGATGSNIGGNGGDGISNNITGIATYYAGGGGGYGWTGVTASNGGLGGGGKGGVLSGVAPTSGTNGLGGGGGGTGENGTQAVATGGNGTVILKYQKAGTPTPSFTSDVVSGITPLAVQFNDTSVTTPTAWNWSFKHVTPGNNTDIWWSTLQNPTNTFTTGSYNIHLNVSNSTGFATTSADYIITVSGAPQPSTAQFTMITSGGSYPSGALTEDSDNPTMSAITFGETTEYSIIQDPNNPVIIDNWYRKLVGSAPTIWYTNATNDMGDNWATPTLLTDITSNGVPGAAPNGILPVVVYDPTTAKYYMFVQQNTSAGNYYIHLYNSTNKINWTIMNNGNPVVQGGTTADTATIFNVGVAIVNDSYWAMLVEGTASFKLSYTYSNLAELDWTSHLSSSAVIPAVSGNPHLEYIPERNALLAVSGYGSPWKIGTYNASLNKNPSLAASWTNNGNLISVGGVHITDPSVAHVTGKTYKTNIIYNYAQVDGRQQFVDLSQLQWYDYLTTGTYTQEYPPDSITGLPILAINFTDLSTLSPTAWNWSFTNVKGNNTQVWFSQLQNPVHTFGVGNYSIVLNATNAIGSNITAEWIFVNVSSSDPIASFTSNVVSGVEPLAVQFNDTTVTNPSAWNWSFKHITPGNNTDIWWSTLQNPTNTFAAGNYNIHLNVSNSTGFAVTGADYWVNVTTFVPTTTADFTCSPLTGSTFTTITCWDESTGYEPTAWNWSFGDGVYSNLENPAIIYDNYGLYDVNLSVYNASTANSSKVRIGYILIQNPPPVPSFTSNVVSGITPLAVQFNDTSVTTPTAWNWSFKHVTPGNNTDIWWSTLQNPTNTFATGSYNIHLNVSNSTGFATSTADYWVNVTDPIITPNFTCSPLTGTTIDTITCIDLSTGYEPTAWNWSFGDGIYSALENPAIVYSTNGVYDVNLTVYNVTTGYFSKVRSSYITIAGSGVYSGWNRQDIIMEPQYTVTITFRDASSSAIIPIVTVLTSTGDNTTTTAGVYTHVFNYTVLVVSGSATDYYSNTGSYIVDRDRTETIYLTAIDYPTNSTISRQILYSPHLVRFRAVDYSGHPLEWLNVTAYVEETSTPYTWIFDVLGIDTDEVMIRNTTMTGTSGTDGAIVFLMIETLRYRVSFENTTLAINEHMDVYPKEDNYEYVFWTETPARASSTITATLWNTTHNATHMNLFASYTDTGSTTTSLVFTVLNEDNTTLYTNISTTPNSWSVSYPVLIERGTAYIWTISGNSTRFAKPITKSKWIRFAGSPTIPFTLGTEWNNWVALGTIFVVALLFSRASIKYAAAIVPLLALFFQQIGWLQISGLMISVIVFFGIMFYIRYAEQESDI